MTTAPTTPPASCQCECFPVRPPTTPPATHSPLQAKIGGPAWQHSFACWTVPIDMSDGTSCRATGCTEAEVNTLAAFIVAACNGHAANVQRIAKLASALVEIEEISRTHVGLLGLAADRALIPMRDLARSALAAAGEKT